MLREDCWFKNSCKETECPVICTDYEHMHDMFLKSNLKPTQWYKYDFIAVKDDVRAYQELQDIIKNKLDSWNREFNSLYIWSHNYLNGKTTWAIKFLQNYMLQWLDYTFDEYPCGFFITSLEIREMYKNQVDKKEEFEKLTNKLKKAELLVIDDIDLLMGDQKLETYLAGIINERYTSNKSIIYTSHLSPQELEDKIDSDYLDSRIIGLSNKFIEFKAPSFKNGGKN